MKKIIVICLTAALLAPAWGSSVLAGDMDEAMRERQSQAEDIPVIIDVLILRPAGLAACAVGLIAAAIALPFAIPSGSTDKVGALIQEPFYYTFKRPLGKNMPRE